MLPWPVMTMTSASGIELLELADQLDAVDVRQHHVGDDGVGPPGPEELLAARADERRPHLVARVLEQDLQPLGHRRLVVDGEDALLAFQTHERKFVAKTRTMSIHKQLHAFVKTTCCDDFRSR